MKNWIFLMNLKWNKYIILLFYIIFIQYIYTSYLPGVQMITYSKNDTIPLFVNSYTSAETLLPIDYYKLPMCQPSKIEYQSENLGEFLTANRIQNSPYKINFLIPTNCEILCEKQYDIKSLKQFDSMVKNGYRVHFIVDNLPVATTSNSHTSNTDVHELGFPLGRYNNEIDKLAQLYNHIKIRIGYNIPTSLILSGSIQHTINGSISARIVDFTVFPYSFDYNDKNNLNGFMNICDRSNEDILPLYLNIPSDDKKENKNYLKKVYWTYSIEWIEMKDREWRTRWDVYFEVGSGTNEIHWFSIINALLVVLFLSGMVAMILIRSLRKDISRYNRIPSEEDKQEEKEEFGWKLVHADVFRSPTTKPMGLICIIVGTGIQLFFMTTTTLFFAAIGTLSPATHRGKLIIAFIIFFNLSGFFNGYYSIYYYNHLYKRSSIHTNGNASGSREWFRLFLYSLFFFPLFLFTLFFSLNLFVWAAGSDAAVPFGSILLVFFLWLLISLPLVFTGAYYANKTYKKNNNQQLPSNDNKNYNKSFFPVATSNIPRPIPSQPWYMSTFVTCCVGGILPFGAIFVELFFVLNSLWTDKYYYVFSFLLLSFLILIQTVAEITIVLIYFQLCSENYHWWMKSIYIAGSCGFYIFFYCFYYFYTRLDVNNFIGAMLYFGYMFAISFSVFLLTGTIGFLSSLWFTKKIYASIKVD